MVAADARAADAGAATAGDLHLAHLPSPPATEDDKGGSKWCPCRLSMGYGLALLHTPKHSQHARHSRDEPGVGGSWI